MATKFAPLLAGLLLVTGMSVASAASVSNDYGQFTLTYDDGTLLGGPSSSFSASGDRYGFTWTLPTSFSAFSVGGAVVENVFLLPEFTITANPGWSLSGPLSSFFGNLVFNEVSSDTSTASTSINAAAKVSFDGGPASVVGGSVSKVTTTSSAPVVSGYFGDTADSNHGSFHSLSVTDGVVVLRAEGGVFASIATQPQNKLEFSVTALAAPVPEPESWAMLLAGLGVMGVIARRRSARATQV